jgi:methanethiol S-methyltransferase
MLTSSAPARQRLIALFFGGLCHSLFLVAISTAMWAMYHGMHVGLVQFSLPATLALDLFLLLQFPILHSYLLSRSGSRKLSRCAPGSLGRDLSTTSFTIIASAQLLSLYLFWSPIGPVWWVSEGMTRVLFTAIYLSSWLFLARAMFDAGMAIQTGFLGWSSVFKGRSPNYGGMPQGGLFKFTRQPIYLAFALTTWTVPVWTLDQLIVAFWFTSYCLLGPIFKERRYQRRYGQEFSDYQEKTPYFLPTPKKVLGWRAEPIPTRSGSRSR